MLVQKLPPFFNVGASQTAIMPYVPSGMSVMGIVLKRGGTTFTAAQVSNIRVRFDGKTIVDVTGSHLDKMTAYNNYAAVTNYHVIPFSDFRSKTQEGMLVGAVDTSLPGIRGLEIEVDIGAATAPTLEGWVLLAPPFPAGHPNKNIIKALLKTTHAPAASGEFTLPIPQGSKAGALFHRVYLHHTNITKVQVSKDGLWLQQEGEVALTGFINSLIGHADQSGMEVWDPTALDVQSDSIGTLRATNPPQPASFEFKVTVSAADTITAYASLYTTIDNV